MPLKSTNQFVLNNIANFAKWLIGKEMQRVYWKKIK